MLRLSVIAVCLGSTGAAFATTRTYESVRAAVTDSLTRIHTVSADLVVTASPDPNCIARDAQQPYESICRWEWAATGRERLETRPVIRKGLMALPRASHLISKKESWGLLYDENHENVVTANRHFQALQPLERDFIVFPVFCGVSTPGFDGGVLHLFEMKQSALVSSDDAGVVVDFGNCTTKAPQKLVKIRFLPEKQWAMGEFVLTVPAWVQERRNKEQAPAEYRFVVDRWQQVADETTRELLWFPEQMTYTTSTGIFVSVVNDLRTGFPSENVVVTPSLPIGIEVREISHKAGTKDKRYLVGGEAAVLERLEKHIAAAKTELAERERVGRQFDARPYAGAWQRFAQVLLGIGVLFAIGVFWRHRLQRRNR